ncbi:MAG: hypothetical protein ACK55E_13370 [Cyanobacteriota bacterium]|jgi:hypothetical protein
MIIRTKLVELSTLDAVAYRQKLREGPGLVLFRYDSAQPGLAGISRTTGQPLPTANTDPSLYPLEAFQEAMELTGGLPFSRRGKVRLRGESPMGETLLDEAPPVAESSDEDLATVDSAEYKAIVAAYTNRKGEFSYELLNKDFIQFAKSSKVVADLVGQQASLDQLRDHIVNVRFQALSGQPDLSPAQISPIVAMVDAFSPRSVFRELEDELRRMLSQASSASS